MLAQKKVVFNFKSIIIVGVPRSGTNMLRDCLCRVDNFVTWPCDEINGVWRHGNLDYKYDDLPVARARRTVKEFINAEFQRIADRYGGTFVVEKTCANTLRLPFVDSIVDDAIYIYISRNPYDTIYSASQRWHAPVNFDYIFKKLKFVPITDIPYFAFRFLTNNVERIFSKNQRLSLWGPIFRELENQSKNMTALQLSCLQFLECRNRAEDALAGIDSRRVYELSYEEFVQNPTKGLASILSFLGLDTSSIDINSIVSDVKATSVGNAKRSLSPVDLNVVASLLQSNSSHTQS